MGQTALMTWVSPGFKKLSDEATRLLEQMERRDGITPQDRVIARLLHMYVHDKPTNRYRMRYRVWGVRREYWLGNFVPPHVAELTEAEKAKDKTWIGGVKLVLPPITGFRDGDGDTPTLSDETALNILSAVRHELSTHEHSLRLLTLASDAQVYAASRCFVAAECTRRWKVPFATDQLPLVRG